MVTFLESSEKHCANERPPSTAIVRVVQHYAAISTTAELFYDYVINVPETTSMRICICVVVGVCC